MTSYAAQILHLNIFFKIESKNAQVKVVTSQKQHILTSFKFNMGQKLLRFGKVPSINLKIGKVFLTLATSNF